MTIFVRAFLFAHMLIMFPIQMALAMAVHWVVFFVLTQIWHVTYLDNFDELWRKAGHTSTRFVSFVKLMFDLLVSLMLTVTWVSFFDTDDKARNRSRFMAPFQSLGTPGSMGANKRRMIVYYTIITLENAAMFTLWLTYQVENDHINWHAPVEVDGEQRTLNTNMFFAVFLPCGYFIGILAMILYYLRIHPVHTRQDVQQFIPTDDYALTLADGGQPVYDETG